MLSRHDQPAPQVASSRWSCADAELDLLDVRARLLERAHRVVDDRRHAPVDREHVESRAVGDAHAGDRRRRARRAKSTWLGEAERVARVVAGERVMASAASSTVRVIGPSKRNGSVPPKAFGRATNGTRPNDA